MPVVEQTLPGLLKVLSEPTRLRTLALLDEEELSVGELSRALGLAQSRVSNHLRVLREADLLVERHAGSSTFLRTAPSAAEGPLAGRLWTILRAELADLPEYDADRVRLASVLAERRGQDAFFDRVAGQWDKVAGAFRTGQSRQRAAVQLLPPGLRAADLGCGTGYLAEGLLGACGSLICVDQSEAMLQEAAKRLAHARGTEVELRRGALDALPLVDGEVDAVVCGMVLHHLPRLEPALAEMHRVLAPGGTACVLELAPHREAWMRERLGDRHLGLAATDVVAGLRRAGFEDVRLEPVDDHYRPEGPDGRPVELDLYLVRGRKPGAKP